MKITSVDQGFQRIESYMNLAKTNSYTNRNYRLERMYALAEHFNHPERSYKVIHIAGSKGKGSTARFVSGGLSALGYTVGVYASPHLVDYRERMTHNGEFFSDDLILHAMQILFNGIEHFSYKDEWGASEPTTFELITTLAFILFREAGCDWAVIETGLGGRLDATNILTPVATAITLLELEHTDILGNTIELIATEKGGIIKENTPLFCGIQNYLETEEVLQEQAAKLNAPIILLRNRVDSIESVPKHKGTLTTIRWQERASLGKTDTLNLHIGGTFQGHNAALALQILEGVCNPSLEERSQIVHGIEAATLPGRCQLILDNPPLMIDGAHTVHSMRGIMDTWESLYPRKEYPQGGVLIFGAISGKDHATMAKVLLQHFTHIIISTPGTFKKSDPSALAALFTQLGGDPLLELDPEKALKRALQLSKSHATTKGPLPILATGSFYLISEIVKELPHVS